MPERSVLYVRFDVKPGCEEAFLRYLFEVIENMRHEPSFISAALHRDVDAPNTLVLYETWHGSKETFLSVEHNRPYREEYERQVQILLNRRVVIWHTPIEEWSAPR